MEENVAVTVNRNRKRILVWMDHDGKQRTKTEVFLMEQFTLIENDVNV